MSEDFFKGKNAKIFVNGKECKIIPSSLTGIIIAHRIRIEEFFAYFADDEDKPKVNKSTRISRPNAPWRL